MRMSARVVLAACLFVSSGVAAAQNAATNRSTDVYAGPDDSYPVVGQLDADTPIDVRGCLDDWSWCDVSFPDSRGWVYAPDITYDYEGGYVPLYTYAPSLGIPVVTFTIGAYWDHYYHDRPWYRDRDDWIHRGPPHHHRPPGPPPSAGPPPRSARVERPHEAVPERALRLGSAAHRDAGPEHERQATEAPRGGEPSSERSPAERPQPERPHPTAEPPHRESHPRHEEPPRHEEEPPHS
jgi:uncharacterized protein YraI